MSTRTRIAFSQSASLVIMSCLLLCQVGCSPSAYDVASVDEEAERAGSSGRDGSEEFGGRASGQSGAASGGRAGAVGGGGALARGGSAGQGGEDSEGGAVTAGGGASGGSTGQAGEGGEGGAVTAGGAPASGGAANGGSAEQGGEYGDGGAPASGGAANGGSAEQGGEDGDGGAVASGGAANGGSAEQGGEDSDGGAVASGGATNGGAGQGGAASGGAGQGGAANGGAGQGGAASGEGGVVTTGGAVAAGGDTDAAGGEESGSGGAASGEGGTTMTGYACARTPVPASGLITDFAEWAAGTVPGGYDWDSATGLSGDVFFYGSAATTEPELPASQVNASIEAGTLRLTSSLANGRYAGFGLAFAECFDASAFVSFVFEVLSGTLGGASLDVQFRSSEDTPIDEVAQIGQCVWSSASTKWTDCKIPSFAPDTVSVGTLVLPFADFFGGVPIDGLDSSGLLGLQLQFGCGVEAGCEVDLVLDQLSFE